MLPQLTPCHGALVLHGNPLQLLDIQRLLHRLFNKFAFNIVIRLLFHLPLLFELPLLLVFIYGLFILIGLLAWLDLLGEAFLWYVIIDLDVLETEVIAPYSFSHRFSGALAPVRAVNLVQVFDDLLQLLLLFIVYFFVEHHVVHLVRVNVPLVHLCTVKKRWRAKVRELAERGGEVSFAQRMTIVQHGVLAQLFLLEREGESGLEDLYEVLHILEMLSGEVRLCVLDDFLHLVDPHPLPLELGLDDVLASLVGCLCVVGLGAPK